jgi:hypothetical protein
VSGATERLIERLAADAEPVGRLRAPALRAALWLLAVAAVGGIVIAGFSDLDVFARRAQDSQAGRRDDRHARHGDRRGARGL